MQLALVPLPAPAVGPVGVGDRDHIIVPGNAPGRFPGFVLPAKDDPRAIPVDNHGFPRNDLVEEPKPVPARFGGSHPFHVYIVHQNQTGLNPARTALFAPESPSTKIRGTVPEGSGGMAGLPFRLLPGAKALRQSEATLTIYHPQG